MILDVLSKLIFSTIEFVTMMLLSFSIFRIPLKENALRTIFISFILALLSYFLRDIADLQDYSVLGVILTYTVFIKFIFSIPIFYSALFCVTGYLVAVVFQIAIVFSSVLLKITSFELLESSRAHGISLQIATAVLILVVVWFLQSKKIGFMFIMRRLSIKEATRGYTFFLIAVIVILLILVQLGVHAFFNNELFIHVYIILGLLPFLLFGLYLSYKHNKKQIIEKYKRLNERNK